MFADPACGLSQLIKDDDDEQFALLFCSNDEKSRKHVYRIIRTVGHNSKRFHYRKFF